MKKIFAFFTAFLFSVVFMLPYTSVLATEVDWGDPVYVGTEEQKELGTKIALLNLLPDLIMNGVSDVTIDNSNNTSLDDYLMNLYGQMMEYSDEGLQSFIDEIDNRANDFVLWAQTYEDPIVDSTLSNFFSNGNYKTEYHKGNTLGYIDKLSRLQSNNTNRPNPPTDFSAMCTMIGSYNVGSINNYTSLIDYPIYTSQNNNESYHVYLDTPCSIVTSGGIAQNGSSYTFWATDPITIMYNSETHGVTYTNYQGSRFLWNNNHYNYIRNISFNTTGLYWKDNGWNASTQNLPTLTYEFETVDLFINHVYNKFRHVNVYVDGEPWVLIDNGNSYNGILSTGGVSYIYNTQQPIQYYFTEPVQIDYQKLYELMVRAFQNGQPVDMTTINQGDVFINSNNTTIAPEADVDINIDNPLDGDFIGTLVGVMALPAFNSSMVQPLMQHVGSATVIATTYTSAIPTDIIELLGACLVISLFICIMHRMLE